MTLFKQGVSSGLHVVGESEMKTALCRQPQCRGVRTINYDLVC